ncbi:low temperature requirement protein A [Plantactinospora sp. B5E13]|uniref:low temperature requirement protein A n=1 Tax=Plantactinospora sp. B5E13 TaxID=3153758 RepID=UPI00325DE69D
MAEDDAGTGAARKRRHPGLSGIAHLLRIATEGPAGQGGERHATWLELFFDLVFALLLTSVAARLGDPAEPSLNRLASTFAIFLLAEWIWYTQAFYDNRFDPDDTPHRILVLTAAAGVGVLGLGAHDVPDGLLFPLGYLAVRAMLLLMYLRVLASRPGSRQVAGVYLTGFGFGWLCWLGSLAVDPAVRPVLWITGLVGELAALWLGRRWLARSPVHAGHLPERIGQLLIILLGAMLTTVLGRVPLPDPPVRALLAAAAAFVVSVCFWWTYTSFLAAGLPIRRRLGSGQVYGLIHVPAGIAVLFLGWTSGQVVAQITQDAGRLPGILRAVLAGSLVIWMLTGVVLQWFLLGAVPRARAVATALGVVLVAGVAAGSVVPAVTLALTTAIMIGYSITVNAQLARSGTGNTGHPTSAQPETP